MAFWGPPEPPAPLTGEEADTGVYDASTGWRETSKLNWAPGPARASCPPRPGFLHRGSP